jgi:glutamyl-tRNA(Gln) amidotransferase subunit E
MFEFKPFEEMRDEDYAAVGLRSGLEVHQQLLTRRKLFCRCPAAKYSHDYDAEILRHMRPTLSELGEYDGTALMEFKTKKEIIYRIHQDTVCTYEMDDTPPFMICDEALDIALEVAMLLNLSPVDELHIARKQYLDGSIPTGFQRTTIVGVDGYIPYKGRRIGIVQLGLEEDSCREVSDVGHERVYLTDRLGMPLIEPVTEPDMRTPREVAEVGEVIRRLLRATGKVRTGAGATRQDVNVSVKGSTRVEIKGVPSLKRIPLLIYNEAMRQWNLLRIRRMLNDRGVTEETFEASEHDVTRLLARTEYDPVREARAQGKVMRCVLLRGFAGVLSEKTQTDTVFAREISDRVRVIACLTSLPNLAHSDSAALTLSSRDWRNLRQQTGAKDDDALVVTWGEPRDADTAVKEIVIRAREATVGVPNETRQALKDGTTGFERILPGAERMYPDTDLPPIAVTAERLERIRAGLPEPTWDRAERYARGGLPPDVVDKLMHTPLSRAFDRVVAGSGASPMTVAQYLCRFGTHLGREGLDLEAVDDDVLVELFRRHAEGALAREGIPAALRVLAERVRGGEELTAAGVQGVLDGLGIRTMDHAELEARVGAVAEGFDFATLHDPDAAPRHLMGVLMRELRGCAPGRRVREALEAALAQRAGADR